MRQPQNSEQLWQQRLDDVPDWVWEADNDCLFTFSNAIVRQLLGYAPEQLIGKSVYDLLSDHDAIRLKAICQNAMEHRSSPESVIIQFLSSSGEIVHLETSCSILSDKHGAKAGFRGVARNVTESSTLRRSMRETLANYKAVTDNSPVGIIIIQKGRIVYANPLLAKSMGYTLDEVSKSDPRSLIHPDDRERVMDYYKKRMAGEDAPDSYELKAFTKSGDIRVFELRVTKILFNGRPAVLDTLVDITDHKEWEQALAETETKYRSLVEKSPIGVYIIQDNKFVYVNPRFCEILGYTQQELLDAESPLVFVVPSSLPAAQQGMEMLFTENVTTSLIPLKVVRKDGSEIDLEGYGSSIIYKGKKAIIGNNLDVTERNRAMEEIQHRIELEKLIISLATEFINIPSSEINTGIHKALGATGEFIGADRSFVFLVSENGETITNTHEWCAPGVESVKDLFQDARIANFPLLVEGLTSKDAVYIPNVDKLGPEYQSEKQIFEAEGVKSFVGVPMLLHNLTMGFLGFETVSKEKEWSEESITLLRILGEVFMNALERKAAEEIIKTSERRRQNLKKRLEAQQRQFYRETIYSVTDGKLEICDKPKISPFLSSAKIRLDVSHPRDVSEVRDQIEKFSRNAGMEGERLDSFIIAAGEAVTNAIKHVGHGNVYIGNDESTIWVGVEDKGPGISSLILPRATLLRGFSTKPSMGLGYCIIIGVVDQILLNTGKQGTTVILVMGIKEEEALGEFCMIPDVWESIPS